MSEAVCARYSGVAEVFPASSRGVAPDCDRNQSPARPAAAAVVRIAVTTALERSFSFGFRHRRFEIRVLHAPAIRPMVIDRFLRGDLSGIPHHLADPEPCARYGRESGRRDGKRLADRSRSHAIRRIRRGPFGCRSDEAFIASSAESFISMERVSAPGWPESSPAIPQWWDFPEVRQRGGRFLLRPDSPS